MLNADAAAPRARADSRASSCIVVMFLDIPHAAAIGRLRISSLVFAGSARPRILARSSSMALDMASSILGPRLIGTQPRTASGTRCSLRPKGMQRFRRTMCSTTHWWSIQ